MVELHFVRCQIGRAHMFAAQGHAWYEGFNWAVAPDMRQTPSRFHLRQGGSTQLEAKFTEFTLEAPFVPTVKSKKAGKPGGIGLFGCAFFVLLGEGGGRF